MMDEGASKKKKLKLRSFLISKTLLKVKNTFCDFSNENDFPARKYEYRPTAGKIKR